MHVLVTGGTGFLGEALCRRLRERGLTVSSLARRSSPSLAAIEVEQCPADLSDRDAVVDAARGCAAVFHVAAKAGAWGAREDYYRTNVVGTDNVIAACRAHGVGKLIYTSSPSVVHAGADLEGVDESIPYARHFLAVYPETKALAERRVLAANSPELATLALRPHLIWGPGDTQLLPRILERARAGRLRFIGRSSRLIDTIYIDNAVEAHLNAFDRLGPGAACAGKAYFISQGQPAPLDVMVNALLSAAGYPAEHRRIPYRLAYTIAVLSELVYRSLRLKAEPLLTRWAVEHLGTAHWFDISAARRDLGYAATVSSAEGLARLREWLRGSASLQGLPR